MTDEPQKPKTPPAGGDQAPASDQSIKTDWDNIIQSQGHATGPDKTIRLIHPTGPTGDASKAAGTHRGPDKILKK